MQRRYENPKKYHTYEDFLHKDIYIVVSTTISKMAIIAWGSAHVVYLIKGVLTMVNPL